VVGVKRCNLGKQILAVGAVVGVECRKMQLGNANLGDEGDEGKEPSLLEPRVGAVVGFKRCTLGMQILATRATKAKSHHNAGAAWLSGGGCREMQLGKANLGDECNEGKEKSSLEPALVGAVVGVERCNLGMQANIGDKGDKGKEPSSLEPRFGAVVGVGRCTLGMHTLATKVAKAKGHHSAGAAYGSGGGCQEMQLGRFKSWRRG
jgi:hypothetical protein